LVFFGLSSQTAGFAVGISDPQNNHCAWVDVLGSVATSKSSGERMGKINAAAWLIEEAIGKLWVVHGDKSGGVIDEVVHGGGRLIVGRCVVQLGRQYAPLLIPSIGKSKKDEVFLRGQNPIKQG
jgi:hypothetical protein